MTPRRKYFLKQRKTNIWPAVMWRGGTDLNFLLNTFFQVAPYYFYCYRGGRSSRNGEEMRKRVICIWSKPLPIKSGSVQNFAHQPYIYSKKQGWPAAHQPYILKHGLGTWNFQESMWLILICVHSSSKTCPGITLFYDDISIFLMFWSTSMSIGRERKWLESYNALQWPFEIASTPVRLIQSKSAMMGQSGRNC